MIIDKIIFKNKDISNPNVRSGYGLFASIFGILSNLIVCTFKIIVGAISGTISILADGINNLADAFSSLVSLVGFKMSRKKPDKEHPFGHERIEYIAGFLVSVIIVVLGIELVINSFEEILNPSEIKGSFILNICVLVAAIFVKLYQAYVNYSIGKKINSKTLIATASDSRNDVIATSAVLVGLIISHFTKLNLDGYLGMLVGLFICYSGFSLVKDSIDPLLGEPPSKDLISKFKEIVLSSNIVIGIHDLEIHSYGPSIMYASCHVEVDSKGELVKLHDEIDLLEQRCKEKLNINTTLHLDPVAVGDSKTNMYRGFVTDALKKIFDFSWSIHDFRIVCGDTHTNLIFDIVVPYSVKMTEDEIKEKICGEIHNKNNMLFCVVNVDYDLNNTLNV